MLQRQLYQHPITPINYFGLDTDQWQYHYHKILASLQGTDEDKEAIVRKRILRFFGQFKLDSETYFSIRNDVNYHLPGIQVVTSKLVMYGIDYMTIERAKNYFQGFITNIRRMDDSHFAIEFRDQNQCLTAINKLKLGPEIFYSPQEIFNNMNQGWIEMKSYYEFIFERKLMIRYATNVDRFDNICSSTKQSFTLAYNEAKRRFMKSLRDSQELQESQRCWHSGRSGNYEYQIEGLSRERPYFRSRSREKFNWAETCRTCRFSRRYQQRCFCERQNRFERCERFDRYERSRSRSRSPSLSAYLQNQPKILADERIKQSDFKFELYIKRRNQKNSDISFNQRVFSSLSNLESMNLNPNSKIEKSNSTNEDDCDVQIVGSSYGKVEEQKSSNTMNNSQLDFKDFLERLKLQDSKNDYSVFELDEMES